MQTPLYPYPTDVNNMTSLVTYTNVVTQGFWSLMVMITLGLVAFLVYKTNYSTARSFGAASVLVLIIAIFFRILGLIKGTILIAAVLLAAVGIVWLLLDEPGA